MELRIATCRPLPEPDVDEEPLLAALVERGVRARLAAWNDPAEDWDAPGATLLRSTWDYIHTLEGFRRWIERAAAAGPLWNPAAVVLGNLHKRYLFALAARGVPVVPTELIERGAAGTLAQLRARRGWQDVVVKPAVGAGSFATYRISADDRDGGERVLAALAADRDVLVQPYQASVEHYGERALVWIDGTLTHAVRKAPRFADGVEQVSEAVPISAAERALAERALEPWRRDLLYARIDLTPDAAGAPQVMEVELVEPSLFLRQSPEALCRFADAIAARWRILNPICNNKIA
jgi:glutathione synthase/RimK-type ligase-like ATP-grasp enzyme